MGFRSQVANDGTCPCIAGVRRHRVYIDSGLSQRIHNPPAIVPADKAGEHNLSTKLVKDSSDVAAFSSRLEDHRTAALNLCGFEVRYLEYAIEGEIRADDKKHVLRLF